MKSGFGKKRKVYVSYFYNPNLYKERIQQIADSAPSNWALVLVVGARPSYEVPQRFKVVHLYRNTRNVRTPRVQICLWSLVRRLAGSRSIVIHDWFMSFVVTFLLAPANSICIYSPVISGMGWLAKRFSGDVPSAGLRYDLRRLKDSLTELPMLLTSNYTVVQSVALRQFYLSRLPGLSSEKLLVSYNPLSTIDAHANSRSSLKNRINHDNCVKVTFIGNLERHKGLADMIWLRQRLDPKYLLVLAGSSNGRENKRILATLRSMKGVVYLGKLTGSEVSELHDLTDCLILPSYHEGSPRVVSEFYLSGKPIVAYANPGLDYCADSPGIATVPYGDISAVAENIEALASKHFERAVPQLISSNSLKQVFEHIEHNMAAGV